MGQRLVIQIEKNGEALANCYYHWSAYTDSALEETQEVLQNYNELRASLKNEDGDVDWKLLAIKMFESSTGGMTEDSMNTAQALYPNVKFRVGRDRNSGLIGITKHDMEESMNWCEGLVVINLDNETINFQVWCELRDYDPSDIIDILSVPVADEDDDEVEDEEETEDGEDGEDSEEADNGEEDEGCGEVDPSDMSDEEMEALVDKLISELPQVKPDDLDVPSLYEIPIDDFWQVVEAITESNDDYFFWGDTAISKISC